MKTNLHILTDEQLVKMSGEGSETAQEILIEKYKGLVSKTARSYFIVGADNDDVVQEGMIGLFKAIQKFDPDREANFKTFAETCITSQILTAIKGANRLKHQPLNESVSFDKGADEESDTKLGDILMASEEADPEAMMIFNETTMTITGNDEGLLSEMELQVLKEKLAGFEYDEIARHLGKTTKQIDNALQRIKKKLVAYLEK